MGTVPARERGQRGRGGEEVKRKGAREIVSLDKKDLPVQYTRDRVQAQAQAQHGGVLHRDSSP